MKYAFVLLKGGLGNQLFIYSFVLWLENLGFKVIVDDVIGFKRDKKYRRKNDLLHLGLHYRKLSVSMFSPFRYVTWRLIGLVNYFRLSTKLFYRFDESRNDLAISLDIINKYKPALLLCNGYFQTAALAKEFEQQVYSKMTKTVDVCHTDATTSACMHVRFFDQIVNGPNNVPVSFYKLSIEILLAKKPEIQKVFIVSEKPITLNMLGLDQVKIEIVIRPVSASQFDDFLFLSSFQNIIISNSTFSYWAAMFNSDDKTIIAPKYEKRGEGSWGADYLLPLSWIKIP